jgi:hypothetical protein
MSVATSTTIVGVFTDRTQADRAVDALRDAGFTNSHIGVASRDQGSSINRTGAATDEGHAGTGAVSGAAVGAGLGGLVGLGVLSGVIPVIGPAIAAGTLGIILSNAAGGAAIAGLAGALMGWGVPEEDAKYYEGEFSSGRIIVTVSADERANEARAILRRFGATGRDRTSL